MSLFVVIYNFLEQIILAQAFIIIWNLCKYYNRAHRFFFYKIKDKKQENENDEWISISFISHTENEYVENFYDSLEDVPQNILVKEIPTENDTNVNAPNAGKLFVYCAKFLPVGNSSIASEERRYIVRDMPLSKTPLSLGIEPSKVKILFAEYKNMKNSRVVLFENMNHYCNVGNELFTPTFVRRILAHVNEESNYTDDYEIIVMDSNMGIFTLTPDKYILIEKERLIEMNDQK